MPHRTETAAELDKWVYPLHSLDLMTDTIRIMAPEIEEQHRQPIARKAQELFDILGSSLFSYYEVYLVIYLCSSWCGTPSTRPLTPTDPEQMTRQTAPALKPHATFTESVHQFMRPAPSSNAIDSMFDKWQTAHARLADGVPPCFLDMGYFVFLCAGVCKRAAIGAGELHQTSYFPKRVLH